MVSNETTHNDIFVAILEVVQSPYEEIESSLAVDRWEKVYGDDEYQKAIELFEQSAENFSDWGMTHFWRLRAAIRTGDIEQAQQQLVKCRESLPQLDELLNRWEIVLEGFLQDNKPSKNELNELDTYTDEQLQNKWEKPQWVVEKCQYCNNSGRSN